MTRSRFPSTSITTVPSQGGAGLQSRLDLLTALTAAAARLHSGLYALLGVPQHVVTRLVDH
jgi:hypothetical protein